MWVLALLPDKYVILDRSPGLPWLLWTDVYVLQDAYVEILTPNVIVGGGPFGRLLQHESLHEWNQCSYKGDPREAPQLFLQQEVSNLQAVRGLSQTPTMLYPILRLPASETEKCMLFISCIRVIHRNRTNGICGDVYKRRYIMGLDSCKKSHEMPLASWRPRKANGIIQSKSEGLRTRAGTTTGINPGLQNPENQELQCLRAGEDDVTAQEKEFTFPLPFCFSPALNGVDDSYLCV